MKLLTRCLLSALCGLMYSYSMAQTVATGIEGRVLTEFMQPAEGATVRLLNHPDSILIASTTSDKNGFFEFKQIKAGNYFIAISKVGYKRFYTVKYQVIAHNNVKTPEVTLVPLTHQLKEVSIISKKDFIEVRSDKTILNVDRSIVSAGNSVLDVLKIAPGVKVIGDEVLFKGGQKALIAINGKTVLLTGEQLTDMLKTYQSSTISQVELIENPSARYDASGGGVINIILKKNRDLGFRANISESGAIGDKYKLNITTNINYRSKKLNLFGSYTYAESKIPRTWDIDRNIYKNNDVAGYNVGYLGTTHLQSHSFNAGGDFAITPKQNIGILFHGYVNPIGIDKNNTTHITNNGRLDSSIITHSFIDRHIDNLNYNLNYRGVFGKFGQHTLSADLDYSDYDRRSLEDLYNIFLNTSGAQYRDTLFSLVTSPADINVYAARVDYTRLINKTMTLDAGVKLSKVYSDNKIDFKQKQNSGYNLVPDLTDHFVYHEKINAAYINYSGKFNKWSVNAGVRAEQTMANRKSFDPNRVADTSYFSLFPNLQVNYDLSIDHQFSFVYNRRITRANYQDLNPFVAYIDQYAYSTGNPFLRPQYMSSFQVSDIYRIKFKGTLSFNVISDFFTTVFRQDDKTGVYTTTKDNIGTRYQYLFELQAPFEITKWWQINNYLETSYERYAYKDPAAVNKSTYDLLLRVNQTFSFAAKYRAELNASYETPTYFGIKSYREQYFFSAGAGRSILNDQGNIRLAVSDIFNTQVDRYSTRFLNLDLKGREKAGTRFVTLTFSYRFGNITLKGARKRVGGTTDEQSRLTGSSSEN